MKHMNRCLSLILAFFMVFGLLPGGMDLSIEAKAAMAGNGTASDPYIIMSEDDWRAASWASSNVYYKLGADITINSNSTTNESYLRANFDGAGKTITINVSTCSNQYYDNGFLFSEIEPSGVFKNCNVLAARGLTFENSTSHDMNYGVIAGENKGLIKNCRVAPESGRIYINCYNRATDTDSKQYNYGVIAGHNTGNGEIVGCIVEDFGLYMINYSDSRMLVGGIAGRNGPNDPDYNYSRYPLMLNCLAKDIGLHVENYTSQSQNHYMSEEFGAVVGRGMGGTIEGCFGSLNMMKGTKTEQGSTCTLQPNIFGGGIIERFSRNYYTLDGIGETNLVSTNIHNGYTNKSWTSSSSIPVVGSIPQGSGQLPDKVYPKANEEDAYNRLNSLYPGVFKMNPKAVEGYCSKGLGFSWQMQPITPPEATVEKATDGDFTVTAKRNDETDSDMVVTVDYIEKGITATPADPQIEATDPTVTSVIGIYGKKTDGTWVTFDNKTKLFQGDELQLYARIKGQNISAENTPELTWNITGNGTGKITFDKNTGYMKIDNPQDDEIFVQAQCGEVKSEPKSFKISKLDVKRSIGNVAGLGYVNAETGIADMSKHKTESGSIPIEFTVNGASGKYGKIEKIVLRKDGREDSPCKDGTTIAKGENDKKWNLNIDPDEPAGKITAFVSVTESLYSTQVIPIELVSVSWPEINTELKPTVDGGDGGTLIMVPGDDSSVEVTVKADPKWAGGSAISDATYHWTVEPAEGISITEGENAATLKFTVAPTFDSNRDILAKVVVTKGGTKAEFTKTISVRKVTGAEIRKTADGAKEIEDVIDVSKKSASFDLYAAAILNRDLNGKKYIGFNAAKWEDDSANVEIPVSDKDGKTTVTVTPKLHQTGDGNEIVNIRTFKNDATSENFELTIRHPQGSINDITGDNVIKGSSSGTVENTSYSTEVTMVGGHAAPEASTKITWSIVNDNVPQASIDPTTGKVTVTELVPVLENEPNTKTVTIKANCDGLTEKTKEVTIEYPVKKAGINLSVSDVVAPFNPEAKTVTATLDNVPEATDWIWSVTPANDKVTVLADSGNKTATVTIAKDAAAQTYTIKADSAEKDLHLTAALNVTAPKTVSITLNPDTVEIPGADSKPVTAALSGADGASDYIWSATPANVEGVTNGNTSESTFTITVPSTANITDAGSPATVAVKAEFTLDGEKRTAEATLTVNPKAAVTATTMKAAPTAKSETEKTTSDKPETAETSEAQKSKEAPKTLETQKSKEAPKTEEVKKTEEKPSEEKTASTSNASTEGKVLSATTIVTEEEKQMLVAEIEAMKTVVAPMMTATPLAENYPPEFNAETDVLHDAKHIWVSKEDAATKYFIKLPDSSATKSIYYHMWPATAANASDFTGYDSNILNFDGNKFEFKNNDVNLVPYGTLYTDHIEVVGDCYIAVCAKQGDAINIERSNTRVFKISGNKVEAISASQDTNSLVQPTRREYKVTVPGSAESAGAFTRTVASPRTYTALISEIRKLVPEDSWYTGNTSVRDRALAEGEAVNVKITIKDYENIGGNANGNESVGSVIAPVIISPLSTDETGNPIILGGEGISLTCASKNSDIYYTISEGNDFTNPDLINYEDRMPYKGTGLGTNIADSDLTKTFKYQGTKIPFYDNLNGMTIVAIAAKRDDTNTTSTRTTKATFTNENRTNLNDAYVYVSNDPSVKNVALDEHAYYKKQDLTIVISHPDLSDGVNVDYVITAGSESLNGKITSDNQVIDLPANYKDVGSLTLTIDVTKDNYKPISKQYNITFTGAYSAPQVYAVDQVRRGQNVEQEISRQLTNGSLIKNGQEIMIVLNPKDVPAGMAPSPKPVATVSKDGQPVENGQPGNSVAYDDKKTEVRLDLGAGQQYIVPTVKYSFTGAPDKNYDLGKPIILRGQSGEVTSGEPVKFSKSTVTVSDSQTTEVTFSSAAKVAKWVMTPETAGITFDEAGKKITIGKASEVFSKAETSKYITITGYESAGDGKPTTSGVLTILNTGVTLPEKTFVKENAVPYGIITLPQGKAGDTVEINLLVTGSATDKAMEVPVKFTYTIQANLDPPKIEATPVEGTTDMLEVNTDISIVTEDLGAEIYYTTENMEITEADLNAGIDWEEKYVDWLINVKKITKPDINQKIDYREEYIEENRKDPATPNFSEPKVIKYYRPFKAEMNEQKLLYVRAVAISSDGSKGTSAQVMQKYKLKDLEKSKSPTANPATTDSNPIALQKGAMITLSADVNEINPVIYYTTDGTEPKPFMTDNHEVPVDGAHKDSTFKISSGGQVAMMPKDGSSTFVIRAKVSQGSRLKTLADSIESRFTYRLAKAGVPSIVPETNSSINTEAEVAKLPADSVIRLIAKEQNAKIYYTTDGTIPTTSSKLYDPSVGIKMELTDTFFIVSALVVDPDGNYANSDVITFYYQSPAPVQAVYAVPAATGSVVKGTKIDLKCSTEGAKIFYEVAYGDKMPNDPVPYTSQSYDPANPIVINEKTTVKVIAEREGVKSNISQWTYTVAPQLSAPTASITTGSVVYPNAKLHLMADSEAVIAYTIDGSDPSDIENKGRLFGKDIVLDGKEGESMNIRACAEAPQYTPSEVATFNYSISAAADVIQVSPPSGAVVSQGTSVSLSTPVTNGKIFAAVGGKDPFSSSGRTNIVLHGMPGETITIKAAVKLRYTDEYIDTMDPDDPNYRYDAGSAPAVFTYTLMEKTQGPTSSIPTGAITLEGAEAALSAKEGTIYYTVDGTDPTTSSQIYVTPIKITDSMVLKAMAVAENKEPSDVSTYIYTRAGDTAAAMTMTPGGEIVSGTKIELTTPTDGATIYYSTNGMTPSLEVLDELFVYTDPINVTRPVTLKFFAYKEGLHPSPVNTVTYTVYDPPVPEPPKEPEEGLRPTVTDRLTSRRTFDSDEIGPSYTDIVLYDRQYSTVVSGESKSVPDETILVTKQIPHTKDEEKSVKKEQADFGILQLYDITLTKNGVEIQPESEIEIGLPIPSEYQNGIVLICRLNDDSSAEFIPTRRAGGMAYAKVEHLSKYALVSPMRDKEAENAKWLLIGGIALGALALGGLVAFLLWKKKKQSDEESDETEV